jgi:hypothetical protein
MRLSELQNESNLPIRPYFYLSYARAGAEETSRVQQFFEDLSDTVRIRAQLPLTAKVGCCDAVKEDAGDRETGLRTSCLMIALLSPAYFEDETAGGEWQIFEMRKARASSTDPKALTRSIVPIAWWPYAGPLPLVISQTPIFVNGGHTQETVGTMLRSRGKNRTYADFVKSLADYILTATASFQLPELDETPDEVLNAFTNRDDSGGTSQTTNTPPNQHGYQNINQNLLIIDGAFLKGVAEQIKETAPRPAPNAKPEETTQSSKRAKEKYLVFAVDDEAEYIEKIEATARFSRDFDIKTYRDSEQLLTEVTNLSNDRQEPDLIVVNPALTLPGTHRFKLIDALLEKKVPSAILAISKDPGAGRTLESAGINDLVATLPEPFTSADLLQWMRHWAKTGRDKRYRRGRSDDRPVFLSFSSADEAMASKICKWLELREIGVWYSPTTLNPGDAWVEKLVQGLGSAEVFIALISENYPRSKYCQAELGVIMDRLRNESPDLLVIPVHYRSPTTALKDPQVKMVLDRQRVKISDQDWLDGLHEILLSVQNFLKRRQN